MFASLLKEHKQRQAQHRALINDRKNALHQSVQSINQTNLNVLTQSINQSFVNQKKIENQLLRLQNDSKKINDEIERWIAINHTINQSIKEMGDVANWSNHLDTELTSVAQSLATIIAYKENERRIQQANQTMNQSIKQPQAI